jgi:hypothetical protein
MYFTVCEENLFLSLDLFSGESGSKESRSYRTGPPASCPLSSLSGARGRGRGYVFNCGTSDRHAIPAAIAGAAQLLSTSAAVIYVTFVLNHKTSNPFRSELV